MATLLHPVDGVRILLELEEPIDGRVHYRGAVLTAEARVDYRVLVGGAGEIELIPVADAASPRGVELLHAIARTVARHALAEEPRVWPRRVLRWRKG